MKQIINYRIVVPALFSLLVFISCKKTGQKEKDIPAISQEDDKMLFAKIMSVAVTEKAVRDFLKTEALKKFDADYDVFFPLVKDKVLSNGTGFTDYLNSIARQQGVKEDIVAITNRMPLLTILIPQTAEFSADTWNTETTIPIAGIRDVSGLKNGKKMVAFNANLDKIELDYKTDPTQPVIVIKDNEALQIVTEGTTGRSMRAGSYQYASPHEPFLVSNGLSYYFADEYLYDQPTTNNPPSEDEGTGKVSPSVARGEGGACDRLCPMQYFDSRVQEAFQKSIYNPICPDNVATVRDYVYYGIDPTTGVNQGPLNYAYREYITSIKCDNLTGRGRFDDFSEGSVLDFDIIIYTADSDPIFPLKKRLSIQKDQFFLTDVDNPTPRAYDLVGYPRQPIELAVWNFKRQGDIWKFGLFEFDPGTTVSVTKSVSATLGTNFTIGEEKAGGKFGITATVTASKSTTITYTDGSDDLGEAVLYWCDPVIKSTVLETTGTESICGLPHLRRPPRRIMSTLWGRTNEISTGLISMTIEPRFKP